MERPTASPILAQLRSAETYRQQRDALQALKNEIVGHPQKKEAWIALGVLEPIARALSTTRSAGKASNQDGRIRTRVEPLSEHDSVKLQALQLVASFAKCGPPALQPIHAARLLPTVVDNIRPYTNPPQILLAALRALSSITDASLYALPSAPISTDSIADLLFSQPCLRLLNALVSISVTDTIIQSQLQVTITLISRLCKEEKHRNLLVNAGVLDTLATRLASFAVRDGYVLPGADDLAAKDGLLDLFPAAAPRQARLGPVLDAINAILGDSKYRANRLVSCPVMLAVFPFVRYDAAPSSWDILRPDTEIDTHSQLLDATMMDYIIPLIPSSTRGASSSYATVPIPDFAESQSSRSYLAKTEQRFLGSYRVPFGGDADQDNAESPLIPWLIYIVRTQSTYDRLMAASVLASLFRADLGNKTCREATLGALIVPVLIDMVTRNDTEELIADDTDGLLQRMVLERAPVVLARLLTDSEHLQKAAFEANAHRAFTKLLKHAYLPVPTSHQRFWSPEPGEGMAVDAASTVSQLGETGQDPLLVHKIRVREAALKAIGALASGKEDCRKALAAQDFIQYVYESLNEYPRKPRQPKDRPKDQSKDQSGDDSNRSGPTSGYGVNPVPVLVAGCYVVRTLARSVGVLRTALVDHSITFPIFRFLQHQDINVQIAATTTVTNLLLGVSPVRELLDELGVMSILCKYAHSENTALRLNALWALKHFVDGAGPAVKKECLEQLEPGWLLELIGDDTQDASWNVSQGDYVQSGDADQDMDSVVGPEVVRWYFGSDGERHEFDASRSSRVRKSEDRLATVREAELNPARRARNDDLAIQEQGLNFIRNFIGRPEPGSAAESPDETSLMTDHLFREIGQGRLFDVLTSKLRPKVLNPFSSGGGTTGREKRMLYPHARIIVAVIYVLVHMAAGNPRHRQVVIAQTELLRLLAQQSASTDRDVRVALCHFIINLLWKDDDSEHQACSQRANELRKWGFHQKMEQLKQQDRDLDVRERAKSAAWHLDPATY